MIALAFVLALTTITAEEAWGCEGSEVFADGSCQEAPESYVASFDGIIHLDGPNVYESPTGAFTVECEGSDALVIQVTKGRAVATCQVER